jgi:hypothetical protein
MKRTFNLLEQRRNVIHVDSGQPSTEPSGVDHESVSRPLL